MANVKEVAEQNAIVAEERVPHRVEKCVRLQYQETIFHLDVERVMRRAQPQIRLTMGLKRAHRVARQRVHMDQIQQVVRHRVLLDAPRQLLVHALHVVRNVHLLV